MAPADDWGEIFHPTNQVIPMLRYVALVVAVLASSVATSAQGVLPEARPWSGHVELEGRGSNIRILGAGRVFVPLQQSRDTLVFADLRGLASDHDAGETNLGIAFRHITVNDLIFGANFFYDYRKTTYGNAFHQGAFGLELLGEDYGVRFNAYIPEQIVQVATTSSVSAIQGGNVFLQGGLETAYWGFDLELEKQFYRLETFGGMDAELWLAGGVFHFGAEASGYEEFTGPSLRAEMRLFDLPQLGNDSRLVCAAEYRYDEVRGSIGTGSINVRIPFGPGGRRRQAVPLTGLARRMVAPIVRDIDVVTNMRIGSVEATKLVDSTSGNPISSVVFVDANTVDPRSVIQTAGADSLIIADGTAGTILPAGTITLSDGQVIMAAGKPFQVIGCTSGIISTVNTSGSVPTFNFGPTLASASPITTAFFV